LDLLASTKWKFVEMKNMSVSTAQSASSMKTGNTRVIAQKPMKPWVTMISPCLLVTRVSTQEPISVLLEKAIQGSRYISVSTVEDAKPKSRPINLIPAATVQMSTLALIAKNAFEYLRPALLPEVTLP
jgi:hypothetical protein